MVSHRVHYLLSGTIFFAGACLLIVGYGVHLSSPTVSDEIHRFNPSKHVVHGKTEFYIGQKGQAQAKLTAKEMYEALAEKFHRGNALVAEYGPTELPPKKEIPRSANSTFHPSAKWMSQVIMTTALHTAKMYDGSSTMVFTVVGEGEISYFPRFLESLAKVGVQEVLVVAANTKVGKSIREESVTGVNAIHVNYQGGQCTNAFCKSLIVANIMTNVMDETKYNVVYTDVSSVWHENVLNAINDRTDVLAMLSRSSSNNGILLSRTVGAASPFFMFLHNSLAMKSFLHDIVNGKSEFALAKTRDFDDSLNLELLNVLHSWDSSYSLTDDQTRSINLLSTSGVVIELLAQPYVLTNCDDKDDITIQRAAIAAC